MKKILLSLLFLFTTFVYAENYAQMSTQELIAIMGYVAQEKKEEFHKELQSRVSTMSAQEKRLYEQNLEKLRQE